MVKVQAILLSVLVTLTACTGPTSGTPQVNGTTWVVTEISGSATLSDRPPTVTFADGRVSGSTGCNTISGAYTQNGAGVTFSPVAVTEMACDEAAMTQETAFLAALTKVARISGGADTVLLLDAAGGTLLTLTIPPAPTPTPLAATTWNLDAITEGTTTSSLVTGTTLTLRIDSDAGTYAGTACNAYGGEVATTGDTIAFSPPHSTKLTCPQAELAQEQQVLAMLPQISRWHLDANALILSAPNGNSLTFVAS